MAIVLLHHTPDEWAEKFYARLRAIRCSERYARAAADRIKACTVVRPADHGIRYEEE